MVDAASVRPGGRTARVRAAVLEATVAELIEYGYGGLTVDGVAARAGVNKTTLYRRWGGRDSLIVDAVETFAAAQVRVPDSGDIDEDLRLWARSILATLTGPVSGALVRAVFGGAGDSPQVRDLRHRFWLTRSVLVTPLYYRLLVLAEPLTPEAADLAAAVTAAAAHAGVFVETTPRPDRDLRRAPT
jgi:AcrR family transcriptional regulator